MLFPGKSERNHGVSAAALWRGRNAGRRWMIVLFGGQDAYPASSRPRLTSKGTPRPAAGEVFEDVMLEIFF